MTRVRIDHDGERYQARAPGRDLKRDRALSRLWLGRRGGDDFKRDLRSAAARSRHPRQRLVVPSYQPKTAHLRLHGKIYRRDLNFPSRVRFGFLNGANVAGDGVRDLIYRRLAQLLVQSRGAYGVEFARKRAVASRLMGEDAEFRHWARVWHDAELLLDHGDLDPPYNWAENRQAGGAHTGDLTLLVVPTQR